jgi:5-methylcytosine-specific restriction enzyme subunit McrC
MQIPLENIYYLLCYSWNTLEERDRVAVSIDGETELLDLFAKILINAARVLLKRGIDKNYFPQTSEFAGVKGKFELSETLKKRLHLGQKTICSFDEFSANTMPNRVLVSTLRRLMRTAKLDGELRNDIRKLRLMFDQVEEIELRPSVFTQIRLHRNNRFYYFILQICSLIYENTLPSEKPGEWEFVDFTRDEKKMARLFEAFVRNFYRLETDFRVKRENILWQLDAEQDAMSHLPRMQTDITLEKENEKIIIDTKYYKETMSLNYDKEKIKAANLYQLFSYILNQQKEDARTQNTAGILLYPTIEKEYDLHFKYKTHDLFIKTVNLNTNWRNISQRLKEIIRFN